MDGAWFLAPAAFLGVASGTVTAAGSHSAWTMQLAVIATLIGVGGYFLTVILSAHRLWRHGLAGAPLAPWWISAGCGGLAAAALGTVATSLPPGLLHEWFDALTTATWAIGTFLLI